ncbi:MAG: helix-turn-helix domain-containing protein [Candidatus Tenebribacter davisii]|nr:helix-turn-helix domain-containing protein [Candidatus Tenebribacter davisii]
MDPFKEFDRIMSKVEEGKQYEAIMPNTMADELLKNITIEWFLQHVQSYPKNKATIEGRLLDSQLCYYLELQRRVPILIFKEQVKDNITKEQFLNSCKGESLDKCMEHYGFNVHQTITFLCYFVIMIAESRIFEEGVNSYFLMPYTKDFEKEDDKRYKDFITSYTNSGLYSLNDLLESFFSEIVSRFIVNNSIVKKKYTMKNEYKQVTDAYTKFNKSNGAVFQKFVEIVYLYIIRKEDFSNTSKDEKNIGVSVEHEETQKDYSPEDMLNSQQAADYIDRPISAIYQLTSKKKIPFAKPGGGKLYIKRSTLDNYFSSNPIKSKKDSINENAKKIIFDKHD